MYPFVTAILKKIRQRKQQPSLPSQQPTNQAISHHPPAHPANPIASIHPIHPSNQFTTTPRDTKQIRGALTTYLYLCHSQTTTLAHFPTCTELIARQPSQHCCLAVSHPSCIATSVGDTGSAALQHDIALVDDTLGSSMEQNSSPRWPVREQWDVENTVSYDDECDGGFEPANPDIFAGGVEPNWQQRTTERRHTQRVQWHESAVFAGRPSRQADDERAVESRTRDWLAAPRQHARRFETVGSAHADDHRDSHYKQQEQLDSAPRQTPWRSVQRATASERAPKLKREAAVKPWPNRARTNWPTREDWPHSARQARIQAPWRPNTGHQSYSFTGDSEYEGDVPKWANNEAPQSPVASNAPQAPRPRWGESNGMRPYQRQWSESSTEERPSRVLRRRWASTPRSEWQSTRSSAVEQDTALLRPDDFGESRFHNDSNLPAVAVGRQRRERRKFSVKQGSGSRQAALGLPAWAIAPATSTGPASDGDAGGGGDESLPVRLSYEQRSDADDDDDESEDEDCDDHELELESKRKSRVSALGKTKARAKWSATVAAADVVVLRSSKRKQVSGQRNNGGAGSSKRRKGALCRFDSGCDNIIQSNGLCTAHGGGKRCQYAGGCGKSARSPTSYCKAHGGGKRCQHAGGCEKGAQSPTFYCVAHGGGKRCQHAAGCGKSAKSPTSYCVAHGGGTRCQHAAGCGKGAESSTSYCIAHGGGKRCQHAGGCGKSALSSTSYCIAHGGGRRCQYAGGCDKTVRSNGLCKTHGGGKRCQHEGGCKKHIVKKRLCKRHGMAAGVWD
jgi:hypothetical protein